MAIGAVEAVSEGNRSRDYGSKLTCVILEHFSPPLVHRGRARVGAFLASREPPPLSSPGVPGEEVRGQNVRESRALI